VNPLLRTTVYLWKCVFIGFLLGLDAAWLLSRHTWLEMRMPTGLVIPAFAAGALGLGVYSAWQPKRLVRVSSRRLGQLVLALQAVLALLVARGDWEVLLIAPASLVRDLLPGFVPLSVINPWLLAALAFGVPALFFDPDRYCQPISNCGGAISR